ncbi:hypothetical protein ADL27_44495, partial [Streptomyces sp. NRRL F-6602]
MDAGLGAGTVLRLGEVGGDDAGAAPGAEGGELLGAGDRLVEDAPARGEEEVDPPGVEVGPQ